MTKSENTVLADVGRPRQQVVPHPRLQIAKLERYLARDPKGPKAAAYKARLRALKRETADG